MTGSLSWACFTFLFTPHFYFYTPQAHYAYFDHLHHCFTFPDYQLVPTLEEFYQLLRIPILNQLHFTGFEKYLQPGEIATVLHLKRSDIIDNQETMSGVKGFLAKFLLEKVRLFIDAMNFQAFEEVLALLIYGLVLFPNPDQIIDGMMSKSSFLVTLCLLCLEIFCILFTLVLQGREGILCVIYCCYLGGLFHTFPDEY